MNLQINQSINQSMLNNQLIDSQPTINNNDISPDLP